MCINVDSCRMWDEELHENPNWCDGDRVLKLHSQEGKERTAQPVSTSSDHLAFGHGQHACPGRIFAANEFKMAVSPAAQVWLEIGVGASDTEIAPIINGKSAIASPTAES